MVSFAPFSAWRVLSIAIMMTVPVAATAASATAPADELLLLGVRHKDGALATYLVDSKGISKAGEGIAVPRKKGWWKLERLVREQGDTKESVLWARAADAKKAPPPLTDDEGCTHQIEQSLLFVTSDYVGIELSNGGYCEGAAHPWASTVLQVRSLDEAYDGKPVNVEQALGETAGRALDKSGDKAGGGSDKREEKCLSGPSRSNWAMIRSSGRWAVRGGLDAAYGACRGNHEYYSVDFSAPETFTGTTDANESFKAAAAQSKGAVDALASPRRSLLLVVSKQGLALRAGDKLVAELPLPGAAIVMTQWAEGKHVERWRTEAEQLLAGSK